MRFQLAFFCLVPAFLALFSLVPNEVLSQQELKSKLPPKKFLFKLCKEAAFSGHVAALVRSSRDVLDKGDLCRECEPFATNIWKFCIREETKLKERRKALAKAKKDAKKKKKPRRQVLLQSEPSVEYIHYAVDVLRTYLKDNSTKELKSKGRVLGTLLEIVDGARAHSGLADSYFKTVHSFMYSASKVSIDLQSPPEEKKSRRRL